MLRTRLEQVGTPIGANDMLIAAHALALGCTIVTDNEKEFAPFGTLRVRIGCAKAERRLTVSVDFEVPPTSRLKDPG